MLQRHVPHLDGNRLAAFGHALHAGLGRRGAGQGIEPVERRGVRGFAKLGAAFQQLAIQRQAREVRADHGQRQRRLRCGPAHWLLHGQGRALCRTQRLRHRGLPALAPTQQRHVGVGGADEGHAKWQTRCGETAGQRQRRPAQKVDEVGVGAQHGIGANGVGGHLGKARVAGCGGHHHHIDLAPQLRCLLAAGLQRVLAPKGIHRRLRGGALDDGRHRGVEGLRVAV